MPKGKVSVPCLACGAEIVGWPSQFEKYNRRYCSYACRAADVRGEKHHLWKPRITKWCEECGRQFEVIPYFKNQKYCSRSCFGKAHRIEPIKVKCEGCGKWFEVPTGSKGRFHSMECYQKWRKRRIKA